VVTEMKDILCFNVDGTTPDGQPLARKVNLAGFPTLVWLSPDGSLRDRVPGYLPPDKFKETNKRIRADKGTLSDYQRQSDADKSNVDKRFALARKMRELGDQAGASAQMAEIEKLDPDGKSLAMHHVAFEKVLQQIDAGWQQTRALDIGSMQKFIEKETYPEVLFQAWNSMMGMQRYLAQKADGENNHDEARKIEAQWRESMSNAWKNCPNESIEAFGEQMAATYYAARDVLTPAEKALALEVARKVRASAGEQASAIDTLACCLFMNGQKDEAIKLNARCIELDPKNSTWADRAKEFGATK
jgi:hypothetical protein